jgi:8-oxo-dGTP pyrophosphatase MutT (NUDIX family)
MNHLDSESTLSIQYDHSLKSFASPPSTFLEPRPHIKRILASTIIFHPSSPHSSPPLTLLLRRHPSDWNPLKWETPGGSVDIGSDPSILSAATRELHEEAGLKATKAVCCIAVKDKEVEGYKVEDEGRVWTFPEPGTDWSWAKITFLMEVDGGNGAEVKLQDEEHVEYRWVTEEEVVNGQFQGEKAGKIEFVSEMVRLAILEGFQVRAETLAVEGTVNMNEQV